MLKIGVTLDYSTEETYAKFPWYALRRNYITALSQFGAMVILLHYDMNIQDLLPMLDGLVLTGGDFDLDPSLYNQALHPCTKINPERSNFEYELLTKALLAEKPILGICAGLQLINVALGGSLIQHIPDIKNAINHQQPHPKNAPFHNVKVTEGSLLHKITQSSQLDVNSTHHQAIDKLATPLIASAIAPDGIIEAIEMPSYNSFLLGVQWHPEYCYCQQDLSIMQHFVEYCKK